MRIANLVSESEAEPRKFGTAFPLTKAEIHTVEAVGDHRGISVTELARLRSISKSAVSQVLARLKAKGLVAQSPAGGSARDTSLELTADGTTAYRRHAAYHRRLYATIAARLAALPPGATAQLDELLAEVERQVSR